MWKLPGSKRRQIEKAKTGALVIAEKHVDLIREGIARWSSDRLTLKAKLVCDFFG